MRKPVLSLDFPGRSMNRDVQPQMARGLKFGIWEVEVLFYLCSENKLCRKKKKKKALISCCAAPLFLHVQKSGYLMMQR